MKTINCPHCHARVPHGATVCRGCKAEFEYGAPGFPTFLLWVIALAVSIAIPGWLSKFSFFSTGFLWGTGFVIFSCLIGWGSGWIDKLYRDRVVSHRFYRYKVDHPTRESREVTSRSN